MTDVIPVKRRDTTSLGEFEVTDRAPMRFLQLPKGYIDGLKMEWVSGTSLRVTSGAAYVPGLDRVLELPAAVTKAGLSLSASTWYHVYGYLNSGVPDIEVSTTSPGSPYYGTARSKSGDPSRRYIGSIKSNASSEIIPFGHYPLSNEVKYRNNVSDNLLVNTATTVPIVFSLAPLVPLTSRIVQIFAESGAGDLVFISNPDLAVNPSTVILFYLRASQQIYGTMETSSNQEINVRLGPSGYGVYVYVNGYNYDR